MMLAWRRYIIQQKKDGIPNPTGILFHFDASKNIIFASGNNISQWGAVVSPADNFSALYPNKTNARAVQGTVANQTIYVASDANFNGLPSVRNTSTSGFMTLQGQDPDTLVYTSELTPFRLDMICAFVGRIDTSTSHPSLFISNLSNSINGNLVYGGAGGANVRQRANSTKTSENSSLSLSDPFIVVFSNDHVLINGDDVTGPDWNTNFLISSMSFSRLFGVSQFGGSTGAYRFLGRCAENVSWIWPDSNLTNLQQISNFLNGKYSIY